MMTALCKYLLFHVLACLGHNALGGKIINGQIAPENSMLYMVSVQNSGGHVCGGFLVSEDFVMTAAHCFDGDLTHVVLGTHNLQRAGDENVRCIEQICKHKDYESVGTGNDIMLLKLSKKARLDNRVQIIQLPRSKIHLNVNENCHVAGWGYTQTNGTAVDELRVVDVSIIDPQVCQQEWHCLPANVICAGGYGTNKGFCDGDSGGPLVCKGNLAVGIVSFGEEHCDYPSAPNVYTDISKFLPWINNILKTKQCEK